MKFLATFLLSSLTSCGPSTPPPDPYQPKSDFQAKFDALEGLHDRIVGGEFSKTKQLVVPDTIMLARTYDSDGIQYFLEIPMYYGEFVLLSHLASTDNEPDLVLGEKMKFQDGFSLWRSAKRYLPETNPSKFKRSSLLKFDQLKYLFVAEVSGYIPPKVTSAEYKQDESHSIFEPGALTCGYYAFDIVSDSYLGYHQVRVENPDRLLTYDGSMTEALNKDLLEQIGEDALKVIPHGKPKWPKVVLF